MRKNPHVDFLTPCETAIFRCLGQAKRGGRTVHWRTAYELGTRTQFSIFTVKKALRELRRYGLVASRKRDWGFEANLLEFGPCSGVNPFDHARREFDYQFTGVEPLHLRLKRLLGKARAKEVMGIIEAVRLPL